MTPYSCRWLPAVALALALVSTSCFGKEYSRQLLVRDGQTLELTISTQFEPAMQDNLQQWIAFIADTLLQVYGHWPRNKWQISVSPSSASGSDPIPWGQVHRDEMDRVEFFTASIATTEQLKQAWTGYHELAHLLIPYRGWGDVWFSEGLASYYQNILQARAGILTEQQMWQKLYEGYQRGLADNQFADRDLRSVSSRLREDGGFMRVYWSGAWYFLSADTRLRQQSRGKHTLDQALASLNDCCAEVSMSVPEMVGKLDQLNRVLLFRPLYEQVSASTRIPAFEPIFASLGISVTNGRVILQHEGPGAQLRREIVLRKPL